MVVKGCGLFDHASVGAIAQLGERLHGMQEVSGSIPLGSTNIPVIHRSIKFYLIRLQSRFVNALLTTSALDFSKFIRLRLGLWGQGYATIQVRSESHTA